MNARLDGVPPGIASVRGLGVMAARRNLKIDLLRGPERHQARLVLAKDLGQVLAHYIKTDGEGPEALLPLIYKVLEVHHREYYAPLQAKKFRNSLYSLAWSLVTRYRSKPGDKKHREREFVAGRYRHPQWHGGTEAGKEAFIEAYIQQAQALRLSFFPDDKWPRHVGLVANQVKDALARKKHGPEAEYSVQVRQVFVVLGDGIDGFTRDDAQRVRKQYAEELADFAGFWLDPVVERNSKGRLEFYAHSTKPIVSRLATERRSKKTPSK